MTTILERQLKALGAKFAVRAENLGYKPGSAKWRNEQLAFLIGAASTAELLGDAVLAQALTTRGVFFAAYGRDAFEVKEKSCAEV